MGQQGRRHSGFGDCPHIFLPAGRAGKDFLEVMDPLYLCRGDPEFLPDILPGDRFHRRTAVRAGTAILRNRAAYFPDRQGGIEIFPPGLWLPLTCMGAHGYLPGLITFRCIFFPSGLLAGRTKEFSAEFLNGFIQSGNRGLQPADGLPQFTYLFILLFNCPAQEFHQRFRMVCHSAILLLFPTECFLPLLYMKNGMGANRPQTGIRHFDEYPGPVDKAADRGLPAVPGPVIHRKKSPGPAVCG